MKAIANRDSKTDRLTVKLVAETFPDTFFLQSFSSELETGELVFSTDPYYGDLSGGSILLITTKEHEKE